MTRAIPLCAATALLLVASPAGAQEQWDHAFGLGLRTTTQGIASEASPDNTLGMVGGGVHARYRFAPRWSLELTLEGTQGRVGGDEDGNGAAFERHSDHVTLAGRWHATPYSDWDFYLLLGLGGTADEVTFRTAGGDTRTETFAETHAHLGTGIERRFGRLALGAELRFLGFARDEEAGDAPRYGEYEEGPVPRESSGVQLNLALTFYL